MIVKNHKRFLFLIILFLIVLNALYLLSFHLMVKKDGLISSSYKQFLLENTTSPRLIIESGSNAKYGIDSGLMSEALNISTINIADNAGVALRYKLLRVESYAKAGDIVLLPLEWQYYSRDGLTSIFTDTIFRPHHYYYKHLSFIEKIKLAYQIPFSSLKKRVEYLLSHKKEDNNPFVEFTRFKEFTQRHHDGDRGDVQERHNKTAKKLDNYGIESCYDYVFLTQLERGFVISDTFKENVKIIKRLQKKGIKVLFTWASVTGEDCYSIKHHKEIEKFSKEVRSFLTQNGIAIVGDVYDSEFSKEYMYNTFYHLQYRAKIVRTKRLIERINASPYRVWFSKSKNILQNFSESATLVPNKARLKPSVPSFKKLSKLVNKNIVNSINKSRVLFLSGWYNKESWGRWSMGDSSYLLLFVPTDKIGKELKLKIVARVYGENRAVPIYMDNRLLGTFDLKGEHIIKLPPIDRNIVELKFSYSNVLSPSEIEPNSTDMRRIKLGVEELNIIE